jgi:hypothetical protein
VPQFKTMKEAEAAFNKEVRTWAKERTPEEIKKFQRYIVIEALRRLVLKTPVDTGRARGNWQVTIADIPEGETGTTDTAGQDTIATGIQALQSLGVYQIVYITNNVPYIVYLENGTSKQAPQGMVRITIEELMGVFVK